MEEGGLTAAEVAAVLGLPDDVDPLSFNPFADGVDAAAVAEVAKVSKQITTALSSLLLQLRALARVQMMRLRQR